MVRLQNQRGNQAAGANRWVLLAITAVFVAAVWGLVTHIPSPAQRAFAWFDKLGFPDVKGCKYVRVATGGSFQSGAGPWRKFYIEAFLLSESNGTFTVFTTDLLIQKFQKSATNTAAHQESGFEELDLSKSVTAYLSSTNAADEPSRFFTHQLKAASQDAVLSWECERNGFHNLAEKLFLKAEQAQKTTTKKSNFWQQIRSYVERLIKKTARKPSFLENLQNELGEVTMWRTVVAFGDPRTSRKQLLMDFERLIQNYPHCKYVSQARESILILRQMLAEDQAHALKPLKPFSEMTKDEQIGELVFQLRDQNGQQFSQPGSCDIFMDPRGEESPASRLVNFGYATVPQLLSASDSKIFSRSVGFHRNFYFSHHVMSVGDCALAILERIAGRNFYRFTYTTQNSSTLSTKEIAEAWWKEFREKGEKVMLMEGTERGDEDSPTQADLLLKRYPNEAVNAVVLGAKRATNTWVRARLVELASLTSFLMEEVAHGPSLSSRLAAAKGLRELGRVEGLNAMIGEWENLNPKTSQDEDWDVEPLVGFLANSGNIDAVEALAKNLRERGVGLRCAVIWALGTKRMVFDSDLPAIDANLRPEGGNKADEVESAIQQLLVKELEDTGQRRGMGGTWGGKSFNDPRMCDLAGHVLWARWPDKYTFDLEASEISRDRQRIECLNVWRNQNGFPALPVPPAK